MKIQLLIAIVLVAVQGCTPADSRMEQTSSEPPPAFRLIAESGADDAHTYAVDARDSLAVFGRGREVVVVNVSDPSHPRVLGSVPLPGDVRDVVLRDNHVYAAADSGGLQIINLSSLAVIGSIPFADRASGVDVLASVAYVAARSKGLRIIDVSDPGSPSEIGHIITPDEAVDVVVHDEFAYVAAWYESMRVVDVSDPSAPKEVSFASYDSYDNGAAWSVHVDGDIAVQAVPDMGLRTVDVSDPRNVKLYKVYRGLFAPTGAVVRGRTAFVADQDAGVRVLDLADPVNPIEIGALDLGGPAMSLALSGNVAYVAAREAGLRIVDVSSPNDLREVAFVDVQDDVVDLVLAGDTLVAAGRQNGVAFHHAPALQRIGFYAGGATRVTVMNGRIFAGGEGRLVAYGMGAGGLTGEAGLPDPVGLAVVDLPGTVHGLASNGEVVVAAAERFGLRILRAGDLGSMASYEPERKRTAGTQQVQMLRTPLAAWDVLINGHQVFAAFDDGIHIVDLSSPARPSQLGHISTPERVYRLALQGHRLFAACDDGLRVFDVADPAHPTETSYIKTPSFATALALDGDRVYLGDLSGVVTIVEIANPTQRIAEVKVADRILSLAVLENGLAVASGRQGIRIISDFEISSRL